MSSIGIAVGVARLPGLRRATTGGGTPTPSPTPAPALIPTGARMTLVGDGIMAEGSSGGIRNAFWAIMQRMEGRLQPCPWSLLAYSGTTIARVDGSNKPWISPYAINASADQFPDIAVFGSCGANDNILSNDPATHWSMQDWKDALDAFIAAHPGALLIPVLLTAASEKTGEATWRTAAWNAQKAHIAAKAAIDPRVLLIDTSDMAPATNWSVESAGQYVHPDERYAAGVAARFHAAVSPLCEARTALEVADMIHAATYPGVATQIDTDRALSGIGGTVTGPGVTGSIATSKVVTNTTGATGLTVAQVATSGGRTKTVVTGAGTASATGKIMIQDKANIAATGATPGQQVRSGAIMRVSAGYHNHGADYSGGNYGSMGGTGNSLTNQTLVGAGATQAIDAPQMIFGRPIFGISANPTAKRSWAALYRSGTSLAGVTIELEQPWLYVPNFRTKGAPRYLGGYLVGGTVATLGPNLLLRPTGTVTAAAGGTVRVDPGMWNHEGFTEADFASRRIYKGTAGDTAIGSGTLLATLSGSNWTFAIGAGACAAGDLIYVEVDCNNGIGGTVTARSKTTLTVG